MLFQEQRCTPHLPIEGAGSLAPWLRGEKTFIRKVINRQRPVLGICLGSQLIASALGAGVNPNPHKGSAGCRLKV